MAQSRRRAGRAGSTHGPPTSRAKRVPQVYVARGICAPASTISARSTLDPNYAEAMVAIAHTHLLEMVAAPKEQWESVLAKIEELETSGGTDRILACRACFSFVRCWRLMRGDYDVALAEAEAMVELDPERRRKSLWRWVECISSPANMSARSRQLEGRGANRSAQPRFLCFPLGTFASGARQR